VVHVIVALPKVIEPADAPEITGGLANVTDMLLVAVFPTESLAMADMVCGAFVAVVVSHDAE
jgi:hypothetical protein